MLEAIFLAIVQAGTEFLPISSSGHLAFISNLISEPNLFFFTALHAATLFAVLIFTRTELAHLLHFDKGYRKEWLYLLVGVLPAASVGFFLRPTIEDAFSSYLFIGCAFIFTGCVLYSTKFRKEHNTKLTLKAAALIGLIQVFALFPGISRSGLTISTALLLGIEKEKAVKFSFLLFVPLAFGALALNCFMDNGVAEGNQLYISASLIISTIVCLAMSLVFLNLIVYIVKKGRMWIFAPYCAAIGLVSLALHFLS